MTGQGFSIVGSDDGGEPEVVFAARRGRPTAVVPASLLSSVREIDPDGGVTLRYKGRLDLNTVLSFRDAAFSVIGEKPPRLTLDLSRLSVVEATGIATLVTLARVCRLVNVELNIIPGPALAAILHDTNIDHLMRVDTPTGSEIAQKLLRRSA